MQPSGHCLWLNVGIWPEGEIGIANTSYRHGFAHCLLANLAAAMSPYLVQDFSITEIFVGFSGYSCRGYSCYSNRLRSEDDFRPSRARSYERQVVVE